MLAAMKAARASIPTLEQYRARDPSIPRITGAMDIDKRYRWDLHYAAGLTRFVCDNLYSYVNDTHIDTALRRIVGELESEQTTGSKP